MYLSKRINFNFCPKIAFIINRGVLLILSEQEGV